MSSFDGCSLLNQIKMLDAFYTQVKLQFHCMYLLTVYNFALNGLLISEARCTSAVRAFAYGAMGRRIDPSWGEHIELFLVPANAPRLV